MILNWLLLHSAFFWAALVPVLSRLASQQPEARNRSGCRIMRKCPRKPVGDSSPVTQRALTMLMSLTLAGCIRHQAPVSEQSQRLERTAPMILSSNTSGDRQLVETSRPSRVLSVETRPEIVSSVREALSDAAVSRAAPQQASGVADSQLRRAEPRVSRLLKGRRYRLKQHLLLISIWCPRRYRTW